MTWLRVDPMDAKTFYSRRVQVHERAGAELTPGLVSRSPWWARRSRAEVAYRLLESFAPFDDFLDIGCANLINLTALKPLFTHGHGIDLVEYPQWTSAGTEFSLLVHNLDSGPLPFNDSSFDAVTILMVLEHVFDPFPVVQEIGRVTRPGGLLVINVPNIAFLRHRVALLLGQLPITSTTSTWNLEEWDGGHLHNFTLERLTWLLSDFGQFDIRQATASGRFEPIKRLWPSLLGADLQLLCKKRERRFGS